ncbi:hypothetical protein Btru_011574 [Bulinus truncatus]|nr:hypothetical protein Btru_011574 [Bulinus truncatus]
MSAGPPREIPGLPCNKEMRTPVQIKECMLQPSGDVGVETCGLVRLVFCGPLQPNEWSVAAKFVVRRSHICGPLQPHLWSVAVTSVQIRTRREIQTTPLPVVRQLVTLGRVPYVKRLAQFESLRHVTGRTFCGAPPSAVGARAPEMSSEDMDVDMADACPPSWPRPPSPTPPGPPPSSCPREDVFRFRSTDSGFKRPAPFRKPFKLKTTKALEKSLGFRMFCFRCQRSAHNRKEEQGFAGNSFWCFSAGDLASGHSGPVGQGRIIRGESVSKDVLCGQETNFLISNSSGGSDPSALTGQAGRGDQSTDSGVDMTDRPVIEWLSQDGGTILQGHAVTADNLRVARHQQKDFEKFYFSAMSYIEKGHDLLEEASMLSQCGNFSEATSYKDLAKTLKRQLRTFTSQLEEARERIEGTAKCYQLLDKSYEWALEAMKYVSSMKMEHSATADGLDKLLRSLNIYLSEHPPLGEDSFSTMMEAAQTLKNEKLLEQCRLAKARCQETFQLLQLRQTTLRRARNQLEVEQALKEGGKDVKDLSAPVGGISLDVSRSSSDLERSDYSVTSIMFSPAPSRSDAGAGGDVAASKSLTWAPHETSTPTFRGWGGGDGHSVDTLRSGTTSHGPPSPSDSLGSHHKAFSYPACPSSPYSSTTSSSSGKSPSKSLTSLSSQSSSSLSSVQPLVPSVTLPVSPTLTSPDPPNKTRLYLPPVYRLYNSSPSRGCAGPAGPVKLGLGRTISQPDPTNVSVPPTGATTRPQKKVLKRASTSPVPMLTSPIQEEDPSGQAATPNEAEDVGSSREQRSVRSLGITGSTESLPSMPEEVEDGDLDMSPSHDGHTDHNSTAPSIRDWTPIPVNSHLHRSARSTPTGPMADLRLTEAEIKSRRTVSLIMSEMIQTERDYVRALQFITDHYVPELQRDDVPQMLRGKRTVIFGNLEKIQQFHSQYFLKQLESCQQQPFLVGQYFLQHETMFYLYALYNKNKPKSDTLMMEYGKDFFRQKQLELGDKMDLSSYLLKPVQRMGKYALLLKQLLKECSETEPEYPELKAAEEMVKFQLRHGNDLLAMDSLRECDVNLQEQGRLLRQEEFLVFQGRKKSMRRIFLFEDLILFSKTKRGRQGQHDLYVYKSSFKTADIGMTENYGDSGYKFEIWFRRRSVGENYVLQAPSTEVKKAWVKDISRLLWRQAIRNRETRINELATMGIGNKPCMDIKPSQDNIQDRSINVSLHNRGARTRNSIAVSSFDYLRNGNKRPHSIISVSSTSSSGSSQSSFGLLGSLNLAFDPLDSPRMNRRSFVSNESGIVTDSDTSADFGTENKGPSLRRGSQGSAPLSTMRSYFDVMKSRVLKQKYSDQVYTDV